MMEKQYCETCQFKSDAAKNLNLEQLLILEKCCCLTHYKAGEIIIKQDALSTNVAYIKKGLIKIHVSSYSTEKTLRIVKPPTYLCLPSNFCDKFNHFSVTAIEETEICFIELSLFENFIFSNCNFAYQIILELSKNELNIFDSLVNHMQKNVKGRIANVLLNFSKNIYQSSTFNLPITRQDIGDLASTTRENVSRFLSELQNEKIINIDGKKIEILNEKFLIKICEKG